MKILYIATIAKKRNRLDGETIKCKLLEEYLVNQKDVELLTVDTDNWKKHIFKLIFLIIINYFKCDKIVVSAADRGSHIVLSFFNKIKCKKEIYYFVIGGSLYNNITSHNWKTEDYKRLNSIYVEAKFLKDNLNKIGINNVEIINNFRKVKKFKNNYKKTKEIKFVFFGRVIKEKGIEEAIKLIKRLNEEDNIPCTLDIYGQVKEEYLCEIEKLFTPNIKFHGEIKPDNKNEYEKLSYYDIFILPTEYPGECLPGALIDAYISELAVVVSNWPYAKEYVNNNKNGIIFEYQNYEDMYEKTKKLILENKITEYKKESKEMSKLYIIDDVLDNIKNQIMEK